MDAWGSELRSDVAAQKEAAVTEAHELFTKMRHMIANPATADLPDLLAAYASGVATVVDVTAFRFRQLSDQLGHVCGHLKDGESFFTRGWFLNPDTVRPLCPHILPELPKERSNTDAGRRDILEVCPNEIMDPLWPVSIAGSMRRATRLPFRVYWSDDAVVYADPFKYQIMSSDLSWVWDTGSPRGLTNLVVKSAPIADATADLVVIQDRFEFGNFCHFLYDGITRICHFVDTFGYNGEIFVFGGLPECYHQLLCGALASKYEIRSQNFFFPKKPVIISTSKRVFWFSDQKELHGHPAQMAHPRSIEVLRKLVGLIPVASANVRRLYVSRDDAKHRRLANEAELLPILQDRGFTSVKLGELPVEKQLSLFRGAEIVVGPHGQGLTNILFGQDIGRLIELFHPGAGTDAYAQVARSSGINYSHIIGTESPGTPADFSVRIAQVDQALATDRLSIRRPRLRRAVNLIPASRTFRGITKRSPEPGVLWPGPPFDRMIADQEACPHWRVGQASNTNCGQWENIPVVPETTYCASCWVWIGEEFDGSGVEMRLAGVPLKSLQPANLALKRCWQRISVSGVTPPDRTNITVSIHAHGREGIGVVSTAWQLERGSEPSSYVSTG